MLYNKTMVINNVIFKLSAAYMNFPSAILYTVCTPVYTFLLPSKIFCGDSFQLYAQAHEQQHSPEQELRT